MKHLSIVASIIVFVLVSCVGDNKKNSEATIVTSSQEGKPIEVKYAKGFKAEDFGSYKLVEITDPSRENDAVYKYALLQKGASKTGIPEDYAIIETPVHKVICMTNLQLSNFIKLEQVDKVVGISSSRFLFDKQINEQLKEGKTSKIGIEGEFDNELIMAMEPDLILVSPFKKGGFEAIRNLEIPLITFLGYKESSPLGQAEWIKFTAMLLGIEEQANRQFDAIEKQYNTLKAEAVAIDAKPTVLSGELHSGNWYVVGGNSYLAQLFRDAGAEYFMRNNSESGGFYTDFETVYSQGANADFWRILNNFNGQFGYEELGASDARYKDIKAFKDRKVIYSNFRETPFYENTPVEPEIVLADLIHIFHPQLLPDHKPVYYRLLK